MEDQITWVIISKASRHKASDLGSMHSSLSEEQKIPLQELILDFPSLPQSTQYLHQVANKTFKAPETLRMPCPNCGAIEKDLATEFYSAFHTLIDNKRMFVEKVKGKYYVRLA